MKLSQILSQVKTDFSVPNGVLIDSIEIEDIAIDSRLVKKNSVFFALPGKINDGSKFIASALASGAAIAISENDENSIKSSNPFQLLVEFLQIFYAPLPANIYAITGTNGKTSTAEFTRQILQFLGKKSASVGTLGVMCDDEIKDHLQNSSLTTPDIVSLYKNLYNLKKFAVNDVAIEVSSIGLEQGRIAGLKIDVGAFTNFTQDHLDYHKSMAEYFRCKMILFSDVLQKNGSAVLNSDLEEFAEIKKICTEKKYNIIEYGFKARDLRLQKIEHIENGQKVFFEFQQKNYQFELSVNGDFQAFNALCALGNVLTKYNLTEAELQNLFQNFDQLQPAPGRMQRVAILPNKAQVFIDFAHSPDALINVLKLAREISKARVLVLFGCGGDRDAKKRPIMGGIASEMADFVIVTDDNPRSEKAENIRAEILTYCDMAKTVEIDNRKTAIEKALAMLQPNDILILAGKGHEKYQIIGATKFEFDEESIVKNALRKFS
ncbi:MAG: UDP-N-acetylmuramoyl-L-alanyl-D-glutamate--2,6-diaminopimelate ligase [Pseudomonadota bacterium]